MPWLIGISWICHWTTVMERVGSSMVGFGIMGMVGKRKLLSPCSPVFFKPANIKRKRKTFFPTFTLDDPEQTLRVIKFCWNFYYRIVLLNTLVYGCVAWRQIIHVRNYELLAVVNQFHESNIQKKKYRRGNSTFTNSITQIWIQNELMQVKFKYA